MMLTPDSFPPSIEERVEKLEKAVDTSILLTVPENERKKIIEDIQKIYNEGRSLTVDPLNAKFERIPTPEEEKEDRQFAISKIRRLVHGKEIQLDIYEELDFWLEQLK